MNIDKAFAGPFHALEELSEIIVQACKEGFTDSEASFVVTYKGVDLEITVKPEAK